MSDDFWNTLMRKYNIMGVPMSFLYALSILQGHLHIESWRGSDMLTMEGHLVIEEPIYHPIVAIDEVKNKLNIPLDCYGR